MQKLLYWIAPFYTALIAYGSLSSSTVPSIDVENIDKAYHAGAYFLMMVVWYLFFYHRYLERQVHFEYNLGMILSQWSRTIAVAASIFSLVIGGLLELGQGFISQNRTMDGYDMLANGTGIIIAVLIMRVISLMKSPR
ncbi:VanZ family protein [Nonlabens agnitus]|uniref:VanZ-like domain-containing protein n=1 Tax=Nonlabens agnitus TaxID=870484 RepID=A0A2S9WX00_9FLAO|nr:hypothetical protein [Nonlabens agnitus]PRP67998.1 hypothetical protein BST86_13315 [Nonlabens agnitus]